MKKTVLILALFIAASVLAIQPAALAYDGRKCSDCGRKMGLDDKFFGKVSFLMDNEEELGLTEEQIDKISSLKWDTKKSLILKQAEIDVIALEMKSGLWQDTIDAPALSKLAEKKYDLKKDKAIKLIESYAALKQILTNDQRDMAKKIWKQQKKEMMGCAPGMGKSGMMKRGAK